MGRLVTTNANQSSGKATRIVEFVEIKFPGIGTKRLTTSPKDLTWAGNTYVSDGSLGAIEGPSESLNLEVGEVKVTLSGLDSNLISEVLNQDIHWIDVTYSMGFVNDDGDLTADPHSFTTTHLGDCGIELSAGDGIIEITGMPRGSENNAGIMFNSQDQRQRFPTDSLLDHIHTLERKEVYWGNIEAKPGIAGIDSPSGGNDRPPTKMQ